MVVPDGGAGGEWRWLETFVRAWDTDYSAEMRGLVGWIDWEEK